MRALITGGAGFIGSHLAESLLSDGHRVTVIDNLATGSVENVRYLRSNPGFELVVDSVLNDGLMEPLIREADVVYHLAAAVGVRWIVEHPLLSIQTNIQATEIVLNHASRHGKPVLIASTSEVYGKNSGRALREEDDSIIGSTQISRWLYANSKATDEFLALAYHREQGLPVVIARFFNTIGPRQKGDYGMVAPRFVEAALREEPLLVYGDGRQSRCFTDVRDAVRAVTALSRTPEAVGQVFNIGSTQEITIEALARTILRLTGSRSELRFIPYEQAYPTGFEDMRRRVPDVTKLRRTIGFAPDTPLEENLLRIIDHYRLQAAPPLARAEAASRPAPAGPRRRASLLPRPESAV